MNAIKNITIGQTSRLHRPVGYTMLSNLINIVPFCLSIEAINIIFRAFSTKDAVLDTQRLWTIVGLLVVYLSVMLWAERKAYRANFRSAYEMSAEGRTSLAEHLRRLSLGFLSRHDPGDLSSMLITDFAMAETGMSHHLPQLMGALVMPILAFLSLVWINWRMAVAMFASLPFACLILWLSTSVQNRLSGAQINAKIEAGNRMEEYLQGIRVMKAYNLLGSRFTRLRDAFLNLKRAAIRQEALLGPFVLLSISIVRAGLTLMVVCGAYLLLKGQLDVLTFVMFLIVGSRVFDPLTSALTNFTEFRYFSIAGGRILSLMKEPEQTGTRQAPESGDITFEHASFAYQDKQVLHDICCQFPKNTLTALVGPSGSGKSTLMMLDLKPFLWTYGFAFTYVLAAILLIIGNRRLDNRSFAAHALHVVTQMFFGLLISGILYMAVLTITSSFFYIFGIDEPKHFYEHFKILRLILNFILSPAVIIYTVILYTYFIKIAFEWDLPKGGVAWMVMGFITVALIGRVAQSILSQRYYDWFYSRFTLIAIPPLIMYWIGSIYRIRLYSFTESRFYLMVAGVLMTLFVLMLFRTRTRRYQLMALIFGAAIILFTYIPGISAKSIGLSCQKQRLTELISELKLTDAKTGKLNDDLDTWSIKQDSLLCERYKDVSSVIKYVRDEIGDKEFEAKYGKWSHSEYSFTYAKAKDRDYSDYDSYSRRKPVELGEYTIMLPSKAYQCNYNDTTVTVTLNKDTVLAYPIQKIVSKDRSLLRNPEPLLTYRNDSLLLILEGICIRDSVITDVRYYGLQLFKKKQ